jgi:predicted ATPase
MATAPTEVTANPSDDHALPPFLRRVRIQGYKSIAFCDVTLQPLTILVGRNAAGKSNFLDALCFLRDTMDMGVAESMKRRGGWSSVACRTSSARQIQIEAGVGFVCGAPRQRLKGRNGPSVTLPPEAGAPPNLAGRYSATFCLEISREEGSGTPIISRESLEISDEMQQGRGGYEIEDGVVTRWQSESASALGLPHSLELIRAFRPGFPLLSVLGFQPFVDLGEAIRWMGFYNFHPDSIRRSQKANPGWLLEKDGRNLASVIQSLQEIEPESLTRIRDYLSLIAEEVERFDVLRSGEYETIRFWLRGLSLGVPVEFGAASMSDGTLRILAALVATFQIVLPHGYPSVVGIEEPEASLHPGAIRAMVDALDEAAARTQVLLTTHSAEMLDNPTIRPENVRVVQMVDRETRIGSVDAASIEIIRRKLNTLGGLERENQLEPNFDDLQRQQQLGQLPKDSPA